MKRLLAVLLVGGIALLGGCLYGHGGGGGCGCCGGGEGGGYVAPAGPPGSSAPQGFIYRCSMDGGERSTSGPCPKCGMALDERHKVAVR
ncbi:MAG: heavy metal-binding domain-containing protein [Anaerolineales bacterium]